MFLGGFEDKCNKKRKREGDLQQIGFLAHCTLAASIARVEELRLIAHIHAYCYSSNTELAIWRDV